MGISSLSRISDHFASSSFFKRAITNLKGDPPAGNPNPANFQILTVMEVRDFLVVEAKYPGCTTYEGRKLLLFQGVSREQLLSWKKLDPHFHSEADAPIARFEPTARGYKMALTIATSFDQDEK